MAKNPLPLGEGDSAKLSGERGVESSPDALTPTEAEAGMAEMSKRFHDEGSEIYLPTATE